MPARLTGLPRDDRPSWHRDAHGAILRAAVHIAGAPQEARIGAVGNAWGGFCRVEVAESGSPASWVPTPGFRGAQG